MTDNTAPGKDHSACCSMALLRMAGIRPTRQRLVLAAMLFSGGHRHVTAEDIFTQASRAGTPISLATAYNSLREFCRAGLLREISVAGTRSYFDTDTSDHCHFFYEEDGCIADVPAGHLALSGIPDAPAGTTLTGVDVIVRIRRG